MSRPVLSSSLLVLVLGLGIPVSSEGTTLTFEGVAPPGGFVAGVTPYAEAGFVITSDGFPSSDAIVDSAAPAFNSSGSDHFSWCSNCINLITLTLTRADAQPFSFVSLRASQSEAFAPFVVPITIEVTGNLAGGGTVSQTLVIVPDLWVGFTLGAGFTNLDSVELQGFPLNAGNPSFGIDDLVLPEPSIPLLLGAGMLALARRRLGPTPARDRRSCT